MKKNLITVMLIFCFLTSYSLSFANNQDDIMQQDTIKVTISKFFDNYFESFKTKSIIDSSDFVEKNDETLLFANYFESAIEAAKAFGTGYRNYDYSLTYKNLSAKDGIASVSVMLKAKFQYENSREDINSSISNVKYKFLLRNEKDNWIITKIDTDLFDVRKFKEFVDHKLKDNPSMTKREATIKTKNDKIKNIPKLLNQFSKSLNNTITSEKKKKSLSPDSIVAPLSYYIYDYDFNNGLYYAARFAENPDSTFFNYYSGSSYDCTNFVSQCVWASYGGYIDGNDTVTKNNIANQIRMVPGTYNTGWYGGTGGGSLKWIRVESFYSYVTDTNKTVGPMGTGYNNGSVYSNLSPQVIYHGEVLQFRTGSTGNYTHSVYVTDREMFPSSYSDVYVSRHSDNAYNRSLSSLIFAFTDGYNQCYMRDIAFDYACFQN